MRDPGEALAKYRQALSLGETRPLPELYAAAGAKLAFDEDTLREAVERVEGKIEDLEAQLEI
jgi:oligoendopeptidase F